MLNWMKCNMAVLWKYFLAYCSAIFALLEIVNIFLSIDECGVNTKTKKIILFGIFVFISVIISVINVAVRNKKQIFGDINRGLTLKYGDVIKLGFHKKSKNGIIIVIPVNRCFDLSCENNLINPTSIHGQWIEQYITNEAERKKLKNQIDSFLQNCNSQIIPNKTIGNNVRYSPGTVIELQGENNVTFYLLAFSYLDNELKAQSSEIEFYNTISGLIDYYNTHENNKELFCPIMGDHIVYPYRDTESCLDFMISVFKFKKSSIRGKINIVVYNKLKSKISILDKW